MNQFRKNIRELKNDTRTNRRNDDATIQVIAERINSMQNDVSDLRDTMKDKMSAAVTKLIQMEERQISRISPMTD